MSPLRFFINAISNHPVKVFALFIGDIGEAACTLMIPFAIKGMIDVLSVYDHASGIPLIEYADSQLTYLIVIIILLNIFSRISGGTLAFLAPIFRLKPREQLIKILQSQALDFFQNSHSGSLGNRVNEVSNGLTFALWTFIFDITPVLVKLITGIILFIIGHTYLGIILLIWAVIYLIGMSIIASYQFMYSTKISKARSAISGKVVDMASNIHAVKSYANEIHEKQIIDKESENEKNIVQKLQYFREGGGYFQSIMTASIMIYMVVQCIYAFENGAMTLGDVSFVLTMILVIISSFSGFSWSITHFLEYLGQMKDGIKTIYSKPSLKDHEDAKELKVNKASIYLDNVQFSYPENDDISVFEDLNLSIPAGQKIGLVGKSGAGKSSLISLLLRFYDVTSGSIMIDGQDISKATQKSLRQNIAIIPQDTSLFHRTLMENIRYGNLNATDAEVIEATKKSHAHGFISDLPEGYQTMVGERGVKLSGGQRQRIAIARAILKDAPILILDEATSALDSESERLIQDSLETLMQGKTVIAIAHRLSTIAHLDRLIVMEHGKIIEDGTHDELLKNNSTYSTLWSLQSGGFLKK